MLFGSIVAIVTPMTAEQEVDFSALASLVDWHLQAGTQGIVVLGTTGEASSLMSEERHQVVKQVVQQVAGRVPVWVGAGSHSTTLSIQLCQHAQEVGADGVLVVTPYYNRPTQEGLYQHFCAISAAVTLPIMLYNVPARTAVDLSPETVFRLANRANIVAIKDASADITRVPHLIESGLGVLSGDDATALSWVEAGAHGVVSVAANVVPGLFVEMLHAARQGNIVRSNQINAQLKPLYKALSVETNPIPVKWLLQQMTIVF